MIKRGGNLGSGKAKNSRNELNSRLVYISHSAHKGEAHVSRHLLRKKKKNQRMERRLRVYGGGTSALLLMEKDGVSAAGEEERREEVAKTKYLQEPRRECKTRLYKRFGPKVMLW